MYLTQPTTNRSLEEPKKNPPLRVIAEGMVNNPSRIKMRQLREIDWFTPRHSHLSEADVGVLTPFRLAVFQELSISRFLRSIIKDMAYSPTEGHNTARIEDNKTIWNGDKFAGELLSPGKTIHRPRAGRA